jgi:hypothetical protein
MRERISRHSGSAGLVISIVALILSTTGLADAARHAVSNAIAQMSGVRVSSRPAPHALLLLGANRKFPAAAIPTVKLAKEATRVDGLTAEEISGSCPPKSVDLGSWCMDTAPFPLTNEELGKNDYIWASRKCVEEGGYLPSAAQLLGAVNRVKIESTIHDSPLSATVALDPLRGLQDQREMSSTLVTTQAGSDAAGSEGVSQGATGNPQTGEPNPVPVPAVPEPETLQYVTVYSNGQKGGFAGSEPVSKPQNFRCAYNKTPGALNAEGK